MEIQGRIRRLFDTQEVGVNGFKKRDVVITTEEQYPQHISIQFVQDKTMLLDSFNVGDLVKVTADLRGREWINPQGEAVYFNTIQGWKIERVSVGNPMPNQDIPAPITFANDNKTANPNEAFGGGQDLYISDSSEEDDLPF
ncbi:MAG: DUF3127 domain-containing protein [Bacteroidota bacterium]|nr:DUF3127 domain-containing protein [Bacteroidota bacterium]